METTELPIETHPFEPFIPDNATVLIIGSFPGKNTQDDWYYGAKRNQFWKIISSVYNIELKSKADKQELFRKAGIGITDIILKVRRKDNGNLDTNLEIVEDNHIVIKSILEKNNIKAVYFTSKYVEKLFLNLFPEIKNTEYLPSPSPRYARMSKEEKISFYKIKLPSL